MAQKVGVLLLHGLTGVPSEMRPVEKYLQKLGCETECPMLAGHGGTSDELLNATWEDWLRSAQEGLDCLSQRAERIIVCGLSMGGSIASILATTNKVAGAVLLSPTLAYDSPELNKPHLAFFKWCYRRQEQIAGILTIFPVLGRWIYWTETPPYGLKDERLQRQITKAIEAAKSGKDTKFGLFRTYWISLWQMLKINKRFRAVASEMSVPTLLISSLEDTLVSINNAVTAYKLIGSANKTLALLTGCDHVITLDLKRNYVCRLIGEFLEAVVGLPIPADTEANIDLTIEIHNRLNPLGPKEWTDLVPGAPALADFAETLRKRSVHESSCHTLVFRYHNEPLLMVPVVLDAANQSALVAVPRAAWGTSPARVTDAQAVGEAWQQCERICSALYECYGIKQIGHVEPAAKALTAATR